MEIIHKALQQVLAVCRTRTTVWKINHFSDQSPCLRAVVGTLAYCHSNQNTSSLSGHKTELVACSDVDAADSSVEKRVRFLASCLNCQEAEIRMAIRKYPRLVSVREHKLRQILNILQSEDISKDEILTYPDVFTHSLDSLKVRIKQLKSLQIDKIKLASLRESSRMYDSKIQRIVQAKQSETPFESKEELISSRLHLSLEESRKLLNDHDLETSRLSTLKSKLDLLEFHSVSEETIKDKMWILRFPLDALECRLKILAASGLRHDNCSSFVHLLTCEERYFADRFRFHCEERAVLAECKNKSEYLQKRLSCSNDSVLRMVKKNPKLLSTNAPKLAAHLDFLLEHFSADDLIQYPRIFNFGVDTVKSRYEELVGLGVKFGLRELILSSRMYNKLLQRLV